MPKLSARCERESSSLTVSDYPRRYGPRQTKNAPYNEKGKLRVDVKFAPFSSRRRLTPNKANCHCSLLSSNSDDLGCRGPSYRHARPPSHLTIHPPRAISKVIHRRIYHRPRVRRRRELCRFQHHRSKCRFGQCENRDAWDRCCLLCGTQTPVGCGSSEAHFCAVHP